MSFSQINRYWGEDPKPEAQSNPNALSSLLQKIEERKKYKRKIQDRNETKEVIQVTPESTPVTEEPPAKKLKSNESKIESSSEPNEPENFTILKNLDFKKIQKIKRVLPGWLANPSVVSVDLKNLSVTINDIPYLDPSLVNQLQHNKITHFFPVQSQLIPWLLNCHRKGHKFWHRDACVSAPTGSGKTLSFVLPIIQILKTRLITRIRALVVLPTKDLAFQVFKVFKQYVGVTNLNVICLGTSTLEKERKKLVSSDPVNGYRSLVDIVVTTPGRLVEHIKYTNGFSLSNLKFLIIDEADHVMESTQNDWLKHLRNRIPPFEKNSSSVFLTLANVIEKPPRPQKLLFSATLSQDPEKLQQLGLFQPVLFTSVVKSDEKENEPKSESNRGEFIGKFTTPKELTEYYSVCSSEVKPLVLYHLIRKHNWKRILCFADSIEFVHRLVKLLQQLNVKDEETKSWNIFEMSSKLSPLEHKKVLRKFSKGSIDILVTTDSLARGIDLPGVQCVILYDAPKFAKNYIHRIGRTGRAGQEGNSLVIVTNEQVDEFNGILKVAGKSNVNEIKVELADLNYLDNAYKLALEGLKSEIQKEDENKLRTNKAIKSGKVRNVGKKRSKKKTTIAKTE
ncbi:probable ATP-dependent RNA helicase Dbp73D [Planococcus citri]|uniref:probable ATP-dependent RNA helicase Dbp73D n=1 Tax=Planococcus citri TaxID=170843 RepID=UPI0031F81B3D